MTRFFASLFAACTPTATPRRSSLGLESLEARETPSGIGHALGHVAKAIGHAAFSNGLPHQPSTTTLVTSLTQNSHH